METKQYRITNEQPGPRGVETAAQGLVMVAPSIPGSSIAMTATLTDDEAERAKDQGLKLEEFDNDTGTLATDNRPAAGHIDINAPDAAEKLSGKKTASKSKSADGKDGKAGSDNEKK